MNISINENYISLADDSSIEQSSSSDSAFAFASSVEENLENSENIAYEGFPYTSNFLELDNGLNMHYLDEGSGDPIVLLHGQPTSSFLWRNIIPELAQRGRVIVPDLINFGLSDKTEEPLNVIEDHGALFSEFIDTLGLEDITFIGHDWGGPIELTYAVDNPDNVKALAFLESAIVPFPDASVVSAFPEQFAATFWSDLELLEQNAIDNNLFIEGWLFDPAFGGIANPLTEAEQEVYREPFLDPESREQLAIAPTQLPLLDPTGFPILDPDGVGGLPPETVTGIEEYIEFANYLATTEVPKLLIYGNPGFADSELVLSLADSLTGFELESIGDADNPAFHFIQEDAPEELSTVLGEWYDTSVAIDSEPNTETTTLQITVENIAPENGAGFAALWFGLHDGSFDVFDPGDPASKSLEFLVEDGLVGLEEEVLPGILDEVIAAGLDPNNLPLSVQQALALGLDLSTLPPPAGTVAGDFLSSDAANGGTQGMVVTDIRTNPELFDLLDENSAFPQEVLDSVENPFFFIQASGETETFTVTLEGTPEQNRYFSFASMLFPTNDGFIGNDDPQAIEIFDESGNFIGADFVVTGEDAWDAGTEVNDESPESLLYTFEVFGEGVDENGTIQPFPGFLAPGEGGVLDFEFNGELVAKDADFTVLDYPIARITVTEVEDSLEEPVETSSIDFEQGDLAAGTVITDQFAGVEFSSDSEFGLMLFDSDNITGQDTDLGATGLGNILIISEDGNSANPDDNVGGGTIRVEFDELTQVNNIGLLDIDEVGSSVIFYSEDASVIDTVEIESLGDNSLQELTVDVSNVARLDINLVGSGAITHLDYSATSNDLGDEMSEEILVSANTEF